MGHGALLAPLAVPVGAVLSSVIWRLGFVASLSGVVVLFVLFGVLGGFGTILRLVRTNASLES